MRRLFWIGSPFFSGSLAACGWQVAFHNFEEMQVFGWKEVIELAGFTPDVLVVADKSRPPFMLGVEDFPCLTVFYGVDSHIHSWEPFYAQLFDACLVSLKDHVIRFTKPWLAENRVFWSPAFARDEDRPGPPGKQDEIWDCLFVGTVSGNTPKREVFLREMAASLPGMRVTSGNYRALYPQGRVLLNQCEHGDLNFRVFEAMGMGGALVTPNVGHGLSEMFTNGVELLTYAPDDAGDACAKVRGLLEAPEKRLAMKAAALAAIDNGHRAHHRAETFTKHISNLLDEGEGLIAARLANAARRLECCMRLPYLLLAREMMEELKPAYLAAAQGVFTTARGVGS